MKKLKLLLLFIFLIPLTFCGCEQAETIVLTAPSEVSVSAGVITFLRVSGAEYYTICFNDNKINVRDADFTGNSIVTQVEKNNKHYLECNFNNIFVPGISYEIKVQAAAKDKRASEFSATIKYEHKQTLAVPSNLKIENNVVSWALVENANQYEIKITYPNNTTATFIAVGNNFNLLEEGALTMAGSYKIAVRAATEDNSYFASAFADASLIYKLTLATPIVSDVHKICEPDTAYHIYVVVDENANYLTINANEFSVQKQINAAADWLTKQDNLLDVNLTKFFGNAVNLAGASISVQANSIGANSAYLDSQFSNTKKIESSLTNHKINLTLNPANCILNIASNNEIENLTLYVANDGKIETKNLTITGKNEFNYPLPINFSMVCAECGGAISNIVVNPACEGEVESFKILQQGNQFAINSVGTSYFVETDNYVFVTEKNSFTLPNLHGISFVKVTAIDANKMPKTVTLNSISPIKLNAPTVEDGQGVKNKTISFTGTDNAIGYVVTLTLGGVQTKINKVFTSTVINLAQYLDGKTYTVSVYAVADVYLNYANSDSLTLGEIS